MSGEDGYPARSPGSSGQSGGWIGEDWIARRGRCSPDETALIDAASGESWTFEELDRAVDRTAAVLGQLGIREGDHLGTLLGTRVAAVRTVHAAARLGAVLVPSNPTLAPETLAEQADGADVTAVVCEADTEAVATAAFPAESGIGSEIDAPDRRTANPPIATVDEPNDEAVTPLDDDRRSGSATESHREVPARRRSPDAPAAILFTSGTTGDPKPVVLTAGNLVSSAVASAFRLGVSPDDRWFCELPAYHMGGIAPFLRTAVYGTTAVVQRREDGFDPDRTLANLREYEATGISLVPTQLDRLLDAGELPESLRFVLLGGGPAPDELIERCDERDVPVCPTYGTTETASQVATALPAEATTHVGTVGRPLAVTDVTVVDSDGDPVGPGERGELVVDGPTVTPGYYRAPDATAAAFGEYGLHTGDLGVRDEEGRLWIHGRADDRIVTGGENVDPGAVAAAIRAIDGVEDVAVVGLDDPEWGQRVAALVVPESDVGDLTGKAIREACRQTLGRHELPRTVGFADALPRTPSGTVDREAVRERLRSAADR